MFGVYVPAVKSFRILTQKTKSLMKCAMSMSTCVYLISLEIYSKGKNNRTSSSRKGKFVPFIITIIMSLSHFLKWNKHCLFRLKLVFLNQNIIYQITYVHSFSITTKDSNNACILNYPSFKEDRWVYFNFWFKLLIAICSLWITWNPMKHCGEVAKCV